MRGTWSGATTARTQGSSCDDDGDLRRKTPTWAATRSSYEERWPTIRKEWLKERGPPRFPRLPDLPNVTQTFDPYRDTALANPPFGPTAGIGGGYSSSPVVSRSLG